MSNYTRQVFGFPSNACGWWGMGSVGGNPSQAWVNGTFSLIFDFEQMGCARFGLPRIPLLDLGPDPLQTLPSVSLRTRPRQRGEPFPQPPQ